MDDGAAEVVKKSFAVEKDLKSISRLRERLERALREAVETEMELGRVDGTIQGIPHDSVIEGRAHELGKQRSCTVQQRQMNELTADQEATAKCPKCGVHCPVDTKRRLQSVDGVADVTKARGDCLGYRRAFLPAT
jgi:hypothetical protein